MADLADDELMAVSSVDPEEAEDDVVGLWRLEADCPSVFSLPPASGRDGLSKDIEG